VAAASVGAKHPARCSGAVAAPVLHEIREEAGARIEVSRLRERASVAAARFVA